MDAITADGATFTWDAAFDAFAYTIGVFEADDYSTLRKLHPFENSLTVAGVLHPGTLYGFRVKTVCSYPGVVSPYSGIYYFTTAGRFGELERDLLLFPNPNNGTFQLQLNGYKNKSAEIVISNSVGQIVYQNNVSVPDAIYMHEISIQEAATGIYQVRVITGETITSSSVVIE
ncbi:MAG: T9SS type A sorting domain-containing protein [Chitinophagales bacterium]|nr:T9SS type A sorting domain-containing protein [Chitinophagales bacterium]